MNNEGKKATVNDFWEAMNRGDLDAQLALCTEQVTFTVSGTTGASGANEGKTAVRRHFQNFASLVEPGARMNVRELIAEGDVVLCLSDGAMRGRTGIPYNNTYAFVFRFQGDRVSSVTEFLDTALVETALFGKTLS